MNGKETINTVEVQNIAKSITEKMNTINNMYQHDLKMILNESVRCLAYSNVKYEDMYTDFKDDFSSLNKTVDDFLFTLVNEIVPSYENLNSDLTVLFKNELGNELNSLLNNNGNK